MRGVVQHFAGNPPQLLAAIAPDTAWGLVSSRPAPWEARLEDAKPVFVVVPLSFGVSIRMWKAVIIHNSRCCPALGEEAYACRSVSMLCDEEDDS